MSTPPPIIMAWDGHAMVPLDRFSRIAESSYTSGHAYKMIVQEDKERRRSPEQNSKMWAMLTEVSAQKEHCGRHYSPDQWKVLFLHAWGQQVQFLPSLDSATFVPYPHSSSKLSKRDMVEFLEFITAWGAQNGVIFHDGLEQAA